MIDLGLLLSRVGELVRGATRVLRPYEETILAAIGERLDPAERDVLSRQIAVRPLTQRSVGSRIVLFAFDRGRQQQIPLFDNRDDEHCLARARIRSGAHRNVVLLVIHHGRVSTLEFRRPPQGLDPARLEVMDVTPHVVERSVASAANRLEHGRDEGDG